MQLTFYGVRGSIPTPGPEYIKYGGNTACVHIALADGTDIALDAGTGIRLLGQKLIAKESDIHILLTHNHWDHIQGFPFFSPIYQPQRKIRITPGQTEPRFDDAVLQQMTGSLFPVHYQNLPSDIQITPMDEGIDSWQLNSATVTRLKMNHPGNGNAFCIEADGVKVAYITDNELYPPYRKQTDFLDFVEFAQHADVIIHDAQYMLSDMPAKSGWGHSVAEEAVKLAMACRAKRLALYSHDPERTDKDIDDIVDHCNDYIKVAESDLVLIAAAEGQTLEL